MPALFNLYVLVRRTELWILAFYGDRPIYSAACLAFSYYYMASNSVWYFIVVFYV